MSFVERRWASATLAVLLALNAPAQDNPVAEAQTHLRAAAAAYRDGDFVAYTNALETALALNPASLTTQHNLAGGYAKTGRTEDALALLRGLVRARVDFGMAADADFETLRKTAEFQTLSAQLIASTQPQVNSAPFFSSNRIDLVPEGIAAHSDGRFFVGSMRTSSIYVLDAAQQLSKFATVDAARKRAAIGMTVDQQRGLLWVVSTSFDMAENFAEDDATETGVFGFDLDTGRLEKKYAADGGRFGLNDVALAADGTLYASGEVLHVLDREHDRLVPLETEPPLFGTNGVAPALHGRTLFVSSYPVGIAAIDLASGRQRFLTTPNGESLHGIDGMYWHAGDLIAVQNGIRPWRLLRLELNEDETAVTKVQHLEFANPDLTPTTGAIVGDRIYLIGTGAASAPAPPHIPAHIARFLGPTLIRSAPLMP